MPMPARGPAERPTRPTAADPSPAGVQRVLQFLSPRHLFRALFVDQLRLRREGSSLKLELGGPDAPVPPPAADTPVHEMRLALTDLLDTRPGSRAVLRHLAALEHHLRVQPRPFIDDLSVASLQHMLRQLHGLVTPPASRGAALLLTELHDAAERKRLAVEQTLPGVQAISSFFVDHKIEVKELDTAALDELHPATAGDEPEAAPG